MKLKILEEALESKSLSDVIKSLHYKDSIDVDTSDGYSVYTWTDVVRFGSAFVPQEVMYIQIDKDDDTIFHAPDIESEEEFNLAINELRKRLIEKH